MNDERLAELIAIRDELGTLGTRAFYLHSKAPQAELSRSERSRMVLLQRRIRDAEAYAQQIIRQAGGQTDEIEARRSTGEG